MSRLKRHLFRILDYIKIRLLLTKYFIDPMHFDYQPIPWIGIVSAKIRGAASVDRWRAMAPLLEKSNSLKDIGCCVGYFCHNAVSDYRLHVFGYDSNRDFIDIANYTKKKLKNGDNEAFVNMSLTPENIKYVSYTDITLLLSIWHHWVFHFGLSGATLMLRQVWALTGSLLIFESGEEEVASEFNLPFGSVEAASWLEEYLEEQLEFASVSRLGAFPVGQYSHYEIKGHERTLFAIHRRNLL